ncbi:MAG: protein kinase [Labilithrix sp.]|nr:protein kinase [Labilithrix sp.]
MEVGELLASKYRVERVLGMGGMGVVVAATHVDLEQRVALKFLLPAALAQPGIVERFSREARASVRLKSPHVARTVDTGRLDNGSPFIVMEFLEGRDLDAELEARGPLPVEDAASYVLQACDAIAEAHAAGIVHRDLKPANLFLARGHDGRSLVKVLDFGISKVATADSTPAALTSTETVFGSPAYMSPEQMRSSKAVDERTDIWSVGVVLYELVTRRLPFEAPTALEIGLKASQDPTPSPRNHRPDLPEALERVILRCLEKEPRDRFATIGELATALAPLAHARDRAIAERIRDIASAGAQRASDAGLQAASIAPPAAASSDRLNLALTNTELAITSDTKREARRARRPVALAAMIALGVAGAAILALRQLTTLPAPEDGPTAAASMSAAAPPAVSNVLTPAQSAGATGPIGEGATGPTGTAAGPTSGAATEPSATTREGANGPTGAAAGPTGASNPPASAADVPGARPRVAPRPSPTSATEPTPVATASVSPSAPQAPPPNAVGDAGRFLKVRE